MNSIKANLYIIHQREKKSNICFNSENSREYIHTKELLGMELVYYELYALEK